MKQLKEQYRNLQQSYNQQEKFIQHKEFEKGTSDTIKFELKDLTSKIESLRREKILAVDYEKEKYQTMLHRFTDLENAYNDLSLSLEAKDQECLTLHSHTSIQNTQISTL